MNFTVTGGFLTPHPRSNSCGKDGCNKPQCNDHPKDIYDNPAMKEGCACCQGSVPDGPDEILAILHQYIRKSANTIFKTFVLASTWVGGAALMYLGETNRQQAIKTHEALVEKIDNVTKIETKLCPNKDKTALKNIQAFLRNLQGSKDMQKFIEYFEGIMPITMGCLMIAGTFIPGANIVCTGMQVIYCLAHVIRYLGWDMHRTACNIDIKNLSQDENPMARQGLKTFKALQWHDRWIFVGTSACFLIFAAGQSMLLATQITTTGALGLPGALLTIIGAATVVWLNNVKIVQTFYHNLESLLPRQYLGSKRSQLRRLYCNQQQLELNQKLLKKLRAAGLIIHKWHYTYWVSKNFLPTKRYNKLYNKYIKPYSQLSVWEKLEDKKKENLRKIIFNFIHESMQQELQFSEEDNVSHDSIENIKAIIDETKPNPITTITDEEYHKTLTSYLKRLKKVALAKNKIYYPYFNRVTDNQKSHYEGSTGSTEEDTKQQFCHMAQMYIVREMQKTLTNQTRSLQDALAARIDLRREKQAKKLKQPTTV